MKIKNLVMFGGILISSIACTTAQQKNGNFGKILKGVLEEVQTQSGALTENEVGMGIKEALVNGISNGADLAGKTDGYFLNPKIKIPLPPDIQRVEATLRKVGLGPQVDQFLLNLNRGAEDAAVQAKPIFISAIKSLTIKDAFNILRGEKNAATMFLKGSTSNELTTLFMPILEKSIAKTEATKYYTDLATRYNQIPFVQKINPDLKGFATQKAIDGLFMMVADEELKIRENPIARTTELLKRVFGSK
jgi:Protein of unknown function (DUF4197)